MSAHNENRKAPMEKTIAARFQALHQLRYAKLERARTCAALSIPNLLPPEGYDETTQLPQTFSSATAAGATHMASKMLSAMIPLNDQPFFALNAQGEAEEDPEATEFLTVTSYQIFERIRAGNYRETLFQVLLHLIVVGDVLIIEEDDVNFRTIRLDQYVVRRDVKGEVLEFIYLDYVAHDNDEAVDQTHFGGGTSTAITRKGYDIVYVRVFKEFDDITDADSDFIWKVEKERNEERVLEEEGTFEKSTFPYAVMRWEGITGENYGRSHCENNIGDITTHEAFTEALLEGIAAASVYWMGVNPAGVTELNDLIGVDSGQWVGARQEDVFTISPADTVKGQVLALQQAVADTRAILRKAFLMDLAELPSGDRVTATAIRKLGEEIENVLGGAFSSIARVGHKTFVARTIFLMIENEEIDPVIAEEIFAEDGSIKIEIVTGLQSLNRESELTKLMQMGDMVRNLPEKAQDRFKWETYARQLIAALGFNPEGWIVSDEEIRQQQQQEAADQNQQQLQQGLGQAAAGAIGGAAQQDIQETGGQGIADLAGQIDPAQLQALAGQLGGGDIASALGGGGPQGAPVPPQGGGLPPGAGPQQGGF